MNQVAFPGNAIKVPCLTILNGKCIQTVTKSKDALCNLKKNDKFIKNKYKKLLP